MGSLIGLLVGKQLFGKTITEGFARWIVIIGTFLTVLGALAGVWALVKHDIIKGHEQKLEQRAKPATDKAATERANDTIANSKNEEELHNAVHSVPDAAPAGPSHQLACQRLRHIGKHPASCR
jgi:hypothetical protein